MAKNIFKIVKVPFDRYDRPGSFIDGSGRFHEAIADGIYAVWPSMELYLEAQKKRV